MTTPSLSGIQLLINTSTGGQFDPAVTALSGGRFAVVWRDTTATALNSVKLQILNADGTLDGPERVLGTPTTLQRLDPDITTLTDGSFVVTYTIGTPGSLYSGPEGDGNNSAVMAQRFNSNGTPLGTEFVVNSQTVQSQFNGSITALDDGGFAVVFQTGGPVGGSGDEMGLRTFDADGTPRGAETNYPWAGLTAQRSPVVTQLTNGNLVMAWEAADNDAPGIHDTDVFGITARILTVAGVPVTARFGVNTTTSNQQLDPDITALTGGGFVVTWRDRSGLSADTSFDAVRVQVFTEAGVKVGAERLINTTTLNGQYDSAVTALSDGRFMVAWTDESTFPSADIRVQLFNANGTPSGSELVVNTQSANQVAPTLVELSDGRVMVSWRDSGDSAGGNVVGQIVDPREAAVNFAGTNAADIFVGTRFGETMIGLAGADTLIGEGGNDTLNGGSGNDSLNGGSGADSLIGGSGSDFASYFNDAAVTVSLDGSLTATGAAAGDTFSSIENISGSNTGNDTISGNANANQLIGNGGSDVLYGRDGADTLSGGAGNDTLDGGAGSDTVSFADRALGVALNPFINTAVIGGAEFDTILNFENFTGSGGNDILQGTFGVNVISGFNGDDLIYAFDGADIIDGGAGADVIAGGADADTITGGDGGDWLYGENGNDLVSGTAKSGGAFDVMIGGLGNDTLEGSAGGFDYFYGGAGVNGATGDGNDSYIVRAGTGIKVMNDFEAGGAVDAVRLLGTGFSSFAQVQAAMSFSGVINGTVLVIDAQTQIWFLNGTQPANLTAADFLYF